MKTLTKQEDSHASAIIEAMDLHCFIEFTRRSEILMAKVRKVVETHDYYEFSPRLFYGLLIRTSKAHGCYVDLPKI